MASKASKPLFNTIIDRIPLRPVNCTTFVATKVIASDECHPLHIKTRRRLAAFDPQGFYWRVNCPIDISKKAVVRNACKGEFKKAFTRALAEAGLGGDGRPLDPAGKQQRLTGAVLLSIVKDPARVLTATKADLRRETGELVKKLLAKQEQPTHRNPWRRNEQPERGPRRPERDVAGTVPGRWNGRSRYGMAANKADSPVARFNPTGTTP
ncbi:uncharacterized protein RCC_11049 [Ramularia collo-cygni]|uniref:Uncharacterized protein n=1 Tax=Ramularia collo-cygni TaxID=112498 RepID=A0A2D3VL10_9PEZI|nr:uncharacterized protein RCC_11049 [Ramularia collo-cygni]CZT25321.1 uncharacterized protein RCC_11049 [Ramularia collo-cygni]